MIISDEHKYIFIELPRTGTSAIAKELVENYGGRRIMKKHSRYSDFLKRCSSEEMEYFSFGSTRHPVDRTVSLFKKIVTDYKGNYIKRLNSPKHLKDIFMGLRVKKLLKTKPNFEEYFSKTSFWPYDDWSSVEFSRLDMVIRFEYLQQDFEKVLDALGLEKVRSLPFENVNHKKDSRSIEDYFPQSLCPKAVDFFGPFLESTPYYDLPEEWAKKSKVSTIARAKYSIAHQVRQIYWKLVY